MRALPLIALASLLCVAAVADARPGASVTRSVEADGAVAALASGLQPGVRYRLTVAGKPSAGCQAAGAVAAKASARGALRLVLAPKRAAWCRGTLRATVERAADGKDVASATVRVTAEQSVPAGTLAGIAVVLNPCPIGAPEDDGQPCLIDVPARGLRVYAKNGAGDVVALDDADAQGRFSMALAPGLYTVVAKPGGGMMRTPQPQLVLMPPDGEGQALAIAVHSEIKRA